ncbi:MAG: hypothetical protein WC637_00810 [Victivallales bacterium]
MAKKIDYYPRCFRYSDVPVFQGRKLLYASGDIEYQFYLEWLVSYLDNLKYEVPDCQRELCQWAAGEKPLYVASGLGNEGFEHQLTIGNIIDYVDGGYSYVETVNELRGFHEERVKEFDGDIDMVDPFETWINPFLWKEATREAMERKLFTNCASHFDLGYRIPLAIALRRTETLKEKYEILDRFYFCFNEEASK